MRILGIDFGLKKIGLAVADTESRLAEPLGVIRIGDGKWVHPEGSPRGEVGNERIKKICQEHGIKKIVVGLPESGITNKVRQFGERLAKITNLSVVFYPETLTSKEAVVKMIEGGKRKKARRKNQHTVAAAIILENYLNA